LEDKAKNDRYNYVALLLKQLDQLENMARGRAAELAPVDIKDALGGFEAIGEAPEKWLLASLYRDLVGLSRLVSPALPEKSPAA
jgi:hypothetical protein